MTAVKRKEGEKNILRPQSLGINWVVINDNMIILTASKCFLEDFSPSLLNQSLSKVIPGFESRFKREIGIECKTFSFNTVDFNGRSYTLKVTLNLDWPKEKRWVVLLCSSNDPFVSQSDARNKDNNKWLLGIDVILRAKPATLLHVVLDKVKDITSSDVAYIHIYGKDKEVVKSEWTMNVKLPSEHELWRDTLTHQRTIVDNYVSSKLCGISIRNHMCIPIMHREHFIGVIGVGNRTFDFTQSDADLLQAFSSIVCYALELPINILKIRRLSNTIKKQRKRIVQVYIQAITAISDLVELKDAYLFGHQKTVSQLSYLIGEKLGLGHHQLEGLKLGAMIHDIGKLSVPLEILNKYTNNLTEQETAVLRMHPTNGAKILNGIEFPWPIRDMVLQHHEHLDGSGYPQGISGDDICYEAKIIAVANVADTILSQRFFQPSNDMQTLTKVLLEGRGTIYAAEVVDACLDILVSTENMDVRCVGDTKLEALNVVDPDMTLDELSEFMRAHCMRVAIVMDEKRHSVIGVITKEDLSFWTSPFLDTAAERVADRNLLKKRAHQIMKHTIPVIGRKASLNDAKMLLAHEGIDFLIVVTNDNKLEPVGLLTWKVLASY
ncbi:HD domain-containing protein [Shewanella algae]|uniref:HD domain-containing phosphohydrolase n=1 Tax=Shewanella algae TaxID=38313 RepID=UPI001AAD1582|nr:HD domain-containing phosphohydrolase [Shewanella algae]MBO2655104.1 HD domain-containing protein [Shewanella algae]